MSKAITATGIISLISEINDERDSVLRDQMFMDMIEDFGLETTFDFYGEAKLQMDALQITAALMPDYFYTPLNWCFSTTETLYHMDHFHNELANKGELGRRGFLLESNAKAFGFHMTGRWSYSLTDSYAKKAEQVLGMDNTRIREAQKVYEWVYEKLRMNPQPYSSSDEMPKWLPANPNQ